MTLKIIFVFLTIVQFSTARITAQDLPFKVEVKGEGPAILMFPGFGCPGEVWNDMAKELSADFTCHLFTFAGFNGVPAIEKDWLKSIKEGIETYVLNEAIEEPIIIGHSLGGTLGLWLAAEENIKLSRVISVDGLPAIGALMIPNFKSEDIQYDNPQSQNMLNMPAEAFGAMVNQMSSGMVVNKDYVTTIADWMIKSDRKTYVHGYTDLLKLDLRTSIKDISVPITIIAATQPYGKSAVDGTIKSQFKYLENYEIIFAEKSAHFIMFDEPQWLNEQIRTIISK